jgi:hypothetical protein
LFQLSKFFRFIKEDKKNKIIKDESAESAAIANKTFKIYGVCPSG